MNISPAQAIPILVKNGSEEDARRLEDNRQFLMTLAKIDHIQWLQEGENSPMSATSMVGQMEILVPMAGLIDKDAELMRLSKEIDKLQKDLDRIEGKLNNPKFVDKAPADVVEKEREKQSAQQKILIKLEQQSQQISTL